MKTNAIEFVKRVNPINNQDFYVMILPPLQRLGKSMDKYGKNRNYKTKKSFFNSYVAYLDWVIRYIDCNIKKGRCFDFNNVIPVLFTRKGVSEKQFARHISFYLYTCRLYLTKLRECADIKAAVNYPNSIWMMMADTEELIALNEYFVKESTPVFPQCTLGTRDMINTLDLKFAANELIYLNCCSDFSKLDYRDIQPCAIMIIRQAIELIGRNLIGYDSITDASGCLVKNMTQISWKFLCDCSKTATWSITTPISLKNIEAVNKWANGYVHNPWINKTYVRAYGLEVLWELMRPPKESVKCADGGSRRCCMFGDFRISNYKSLKIDFEKYVNQKNPHATINWMPMDKVGAYIID